MALAPEGFFRKTGQHPSSCQSKRIPKKAEVLCFVSKGAADKYLDGYGPVLMKQRFYQSVMSQFEDLTGWVERMERYGPWLLWWMFEAGNGGKHQGVSGRQSVRPGYVNLARSSSSQFGRCRPADRCSTSGFG